MPNIIEVLGKVKDVLSLEIGQKVIYDKDVASALDIKQLTLATMKKRNKIPYEQILNFCAKRKISINWLLYDQIVESLQEQTEKLVKIKYFTNIYASAGGGAENYDEQSDFLDFQERLLHKVGITDTKCVEALNIVGDSMEPTLHDGNVVFVDRSRLDINRGGIFIISTPGGLFIKRLQIKADGMIDLISDNPNYSAESIRVQDVKVLGKVVGSISEVE